MSRCRCVGEMFGVRQMVPVDHFGPWSALALARNAPDHAERVASGALHLQLVHGERAVRIVTPCSLTEGQFEVHHTQRVRIRCWGGVVMYLRDELGLNPPPPTWVTMSLRSWVYAAMLGAAPHPSA